jgi:hypothetical protein
MREMTAKNKAIERRTRARPLRVATHQTVRQNGPMGKSRENVERFAAPSLLASRSEGDLDAGCA